MKLTLLYYAAHSSSRRLLRVSPAITSGCMLDAVIAHHQNLFFNYYLPPSPWSKHFPTLANFSRRVLICNSLGCFLRLRALLSRMHNLHRRVRVCAHENPKASQRGVVTVISFSPTAVIGFYAPTLHYLQGRGAGGQRCCYYSPAG